MNAPLIVQVLMTERDANETVPAVKLTAAFVGELLNSTLKAELREKTAVSLTPGAAPPSPLPATLNFPPAALPQVMFACPRTVDAYRPNEEATAAIKAARVWRDILSSLPQFSIVTTCRTCINLRSSM